MASLSFLSACVSLSCSIGTESPTGNEDADRLFKNKPATIAWEGSPDTAIESFAADVEGWTMNNRDQEGTKVSNRYKLSMKKNQRNPIRTP